MKGMTSLCFYALVYLLIIIFFNEVLGDPRGVESVNTRQVRQEPMGAGTGTGTGSGTGSGTGTGTGTGTDTNPLADLFHVQDDNMRNTLGAMYGAMRGNDQCSRKAFCMMGNYVKNMPGRDLIFWTVGSYVPKEYNLYYEIFKAAVMYGQDCNVYVCTPNEAENAATAARPKPGPTDSLLSQPSGGSDSNQRFQSNSIPR